MTSLDALADWASDLDLADVPDRVVAFAKSQVLSQLAAIRAGLAHPLGEQVVKAFGEPLQRDAKQSAYVLAGLGAWLHFDDTGFAGHLGSSTVAVPLAYARALGLDGERLLTAVIAANECAARITAATTLGPFRGQNAAHTHLAAAVAGRLRSEGAAARCWVDAFGLAFALPLWPLLPGFLGSDAKVLSAAAPVRLGLDACDAAAAGLAGANGVLEHNEGFLARFATVPLPGTITAGLGSRWHTETLSFKVHPGGPGLDAAVDVAVRLHSMLDGVGAEAIEEVVVEASHYTIAVDERVRALVNGPRSPVSALVFSVPYTVAAALLNGRLDGDDFATPALDEPSRWSLAAKVRVEHDVEMTRQSLLGDVPFGAALRDAGPRAAEWLTSVGGDWLVDLVGPLGPPVETFEGSEKVTPARVTVRLVDGSVLRGEQRIPIGAIGPDTRRDHPDLVRDKFMRTGGAVEVADAVAELEAASPAAVARLTDLALSLA